MRKYQSYFDAERSLNEYRMRTSYATPIEINPSHRYGTRPINQNFQSKAKSQKIKNSKPKENKSTKTVAKTVAKTPEKSSCCTIL